MAKKTLAVDSEKCTGCGKCELVCSVYNTGCSDPERSRIKVLRWDHIGYYLPVTCQNCDHASCVEVCPTGACRKDERLDVAVIDRKRCIGCKTCVLACPFGVPFFDHTEGISIKCDYCGGDPQCVPACEAGAIQYVEPDKLGLTRAGDLARRLMGGERRPESR